MSYRWLRPLLFAADPERIHEAALELLAEIDNSHLLRRWLHSRYSFRHPSLEVKMFGLTFPNPVGIAAGFDKNAAAPRALAGLGFGFIEVGTVTPRAQPGNPRPRLFRLPKDEALINRLGFNNAGARAMAERLHRINDLAVPLGINIGKNFDTPIERAVDDYLACLRVLYRYADYFVVNVSSPNTPGLRELQREEALSRLLAHLQAENASLAERWGIRQRPLLVKVAPDLSTAELQAVLGCVEAHGVAGIIATNTTIRRPALAGAAAAEAGGLSGRPLRDRSTRIIAAIYRLTGGRIPIIGVGGIFNGDDALVKIRAGASLVQVYTGFVYGGPSLPSRINRRLVTQLASMGMKHVSDVVGIDADKWPDPGEPERDSD